MKKSTLFLKKSLFIKDSAGRTIYYPYNMRGCGYYIDSSQQEEQISKYFNIFFIGSIFIGVVGTFLGAKIFEIPLAVSFIGALVLCHVWRYFWIKKMTHDLQKCSVPLTIGQRFRMTASKNKIGQLIAFEILMFYGMFLSFFRPSDFSFFASSNQVDPVFWKGIFSILAVYGLCLLIFKITNKKK